MPIINLTIDAKDNLWDYLIEIVKDICTLFFGFLYVLDICGGTI